VRAAADDSSTTRGKNQAQRVTREGGGWTGKGTPFIKESQYSNGSGAPRTELRQKEGDKRGCAKEKISDQGGSG